MNWGKPAEGRKRGKECRHSEFKGWKSHFAAYFHGRVGRTEHHCPQHVSIATFRSNNTDEKSWKFPKKRSFLLQTKAGAESKVLATEQIGAFLLLPLSPNALRSFRRFLPRNALVPIMSHTSVSLSGSRTHQPPPPH